MTDPVYNAKVLERNEVAPGLLILRIAPVGWELPPFIAGQFTVLGLTGDAPRAAEAEPEPTPSDPKKLIRRAYSVSSASQQREYLEFYISIVRSGALTPRLFALQPGDRLWMSPTIAGMFTLKDVPADQNIVLIATGTGLAPYVSMVRTYLDSHRDRYFAVLHGAYHSWDLGYRTELFTMQRLATNFAYAPIISDPQGELRPWNGPAGFVQDLWKSGMISDRWGFKPQPDNTHVFLCGHPAMIEDVTKLLKDEGFSMHSAKVPGQIHTEKYW